MILRYLQIALSLEFFDITIQTPHCSCLNCFLASCPEARVTSVLLVREGPISIKHITQRPPDSQGWTEVPGNNWASTVSREYMGSNSM